MSELSIKIDDSQLKKLTATLAETPRKIPAAVSKAINATGKKHILVISKKIREKIKINAKGAKESLQHHIKATPKRLSGGIRVKKGFRPSLKRFGAKQKKSGVGYQISKTGGRQTIPGAFGPNIGKLGNHVYVRKNPYVKGGDRETNKAIMGPIRGVSVLRVYKKHGMEKQSKKEITKELNKQISRQVDIILFKRNREARNP